MPFAIQKEEFYTIKPAGIAAMLLIRCMLDEPTNSTVLKIELYKTDPFFVFLNFYQQF